MKNAGILIVDDHLLFIQGLISLLEDMKGINILGHAKSIHEALAFCETAKPDLILMDHFLPDGTGLETARQLLKADPEMKIIMLSMSKERQIMQAAMKIGVKAYLLKDIGRDELQDNILRVLNGEVVFQLETDQSGEGVQTDPVKLLSKREREIVIMVGKGMTTAEVARSLCISEFTVSTHRKNIMRKLRVKGAVQLANIAHALSYGLNS